MMPDRATVRALLKGIGMEVPEDRIREIPGGTINLAFRIDQGGDGPLVVRISPTDAEAAAGPSWLTSHGLRREQTTIGLLDDLVHMLPRTVHFDESREHIDRDWVVQTWVRGATWRDARPSLTEEQDLDLWRQLGEIARRMHAVVREDFGPPEEGLGYETWSDLLRWDAAGFAVDASRFGIDVRPFEALQEVIDRAVPVLNRVEEACLVHSDLNERHVFISTGTDDEPRITGLIDLEFARFADRWSESVFIEHSLLPRRDAWRVSLCEGYECDKPTHDDILRWKIYTLIAMGWEATDLARKNQVNNLPALISRMEGLIAETRDML